MAPSLFEQLDGTRIASLSPSGISRVVVSRSGSMGQASAPEPMTTGDAFTSVVAWGDGRLGLLHSAGMLVVERSPRRSATAERAEHALIPGRR